MRLEFENGFERTPGAVYKYMGFLYYSHNGAWDGTMRVGMNRWLGAGACDYDSNMQLLSFTPLWCAATKSKFRDGISPGVLRDRLKGEVD